MHTVKHHFGDLEHFNFSLLNFIREEMSIGYSDVGYHFDLKLSPVQFMKA